MPDDKMVFGIEFQTNAKQTTKDIKELEKTRQEVEKSQDKHNLSGVDKLNTTKKQIKLDKQAKTEQEKTAKKKKEEERKRKEQQKAEEKARKAKQKNINEELKRQKEIQNIEKSRINMAKKFILGSVATGSVLKFALDAINSGRQLDIASKSSLSDPKTIEALAFISKKFGGDISNVTNTLMTLNDRLYNLKEYGLIDSTIKEVMFKFPKEFDRIFRDNLGNIISDPLKVLQNISEIMSTMSAETSRQFANALGLDNSIYLTLRESNGKFSSLLDEAKQNSFANKETINKLQNTAELIDKANREFKTGFAVALSETLGEDTKELLNTTKDIAKVVGYTLGIIAKGVEIFYGFGKAIGDKLGLSEIFTYFMLDDDERKVLSQEKEKKSYDEYIKNYRRKPVAPSPLNNPLYQEQLIEYQWKLAEWQKNEDIFNSKHNPLHQENFDLLEKYNRITNTPFNNSTPTQLLNGNSTTINNINITNNTEINGTDVNNANDVGNAVSTVNKEELIPKILGSMGSPYIN